MTGGSGFEAALFLLLATALVHVVLLFPCRELLPAWMESWCKLAAHSCSSQRLLSSNCSSFSRVRRLR